MVKPILRDAILLNRISLPASADDLPAVRDLEETLLAHRDECAGMAANMIGVHKRIIAFFDGGKPVVMLNPELLRRAEPYAAAEGCLSLDGTRETKRYGRVKVRWQTTELQTRIKTFTGFTAQVIQHEIDHCEGILI